MANGQATRGVLNRTEHAVEWIVFSSRWLQAPVYLGLIAAQGLYAYRFVSDLVHLFMSCGGLREKEFMLAILGFVDVVMVVNLLTMVVIGGWTTFVSRLDLGDSPDKPRWLGHIDPGTLKTKVAGALIGISGIHLLQTFTRLDDAADAVSSHQVLWQLAIHATFVVATLLLAWSDLLVQRKIALAVQTHTETPTVG